MRATENNGYGCDMLSHNPCTSFKDHLSSSRPIREILTIKELGILTKWDVKGLRTNKLGFFDSQNRQISSVAPRWRVRVHVFLVADAEFRGCMINGKKPEIWHGTLRRWGLWGLTHYFDIEHDYVGGFPDSFQSQRLLGDALNPVPWDHHMPLKNQERDHMARTLV